MKLSLKPNSVANKLIFQDEKIMIPFFKNNTQNKHFLVYSNIKQISVVFFLLYDVYERKKVMPLTNPSKVPSRVIRFI